MLLQLSLNEHGRDVYSTEQVGEPVVVGGDNDPLDIIELSGESFPTGTVLEVRLLGSLDMVDQVHHPPPYILSK